MDARSSRRGFTNGLESGRTLPLPPGHVNGVRGATNGLGHGAPGRTNGLVNGTRGRTNGLVNGTRGRTNGLVNGSGAVNGSGFVNGLPLRKNPFGIVTHRDLRRSSALLASSIAAIMVLGYLLSTPTEVGTGFVVDGTFDEWNTVPKLEDSADAVNLGDLRETAVHRESERMFFYARTGDDLFAGPDVSSVYLLVSIDGADGYHAAEGYDAKFVAEAYGWDGTLRGTVLREWTGASDGDNASAFASRGTFPALANDTAIEIALDASDIGLASYDGVWFRFATRAGEDADLGPIMGPSPGGLRVEQDSLVTTLSGSAPALRLNVTALAADVTVRDIPIQVPPGSSYTKPSFPITIDRGTTRVVDVSVSPGTMASGAVVTARVASVDAVLSEGGGTVRATIIGEGARAYVDAPPAGHVVDGMFLDWSGLVQDGSDPVPASVDIRDSAAALESGAFFYVRTDGRALGGALLPLRPSRPVPGNASAPSPPGPVPRVAGEDVLRIYVDTDDRDSTGQPFGGLVADRIIDVRGRLGRIAATTLYAWDAPAGRWVPRLEALGIALVGSQIEASVPPSFLGSTSNATAAFAMSDWSGATDVTGVHGLRGTRGGPSLRPWHGTGAQTAVVTALTNVPTVDGNCDTGGSGSEYAGANTYGNANLAFQIGRRSDTQHVFVCVVVTSDTTSSGMDWGELMFDTTHGGGTTPQDDDRRFRVNGGSSILLREKGDGTGWIPCGSSCDPSNSGRGAFTNSRETYEFMIRFSDVWGTNTPDPNDEAGFAVGAYDFDTTTNYWWGGDSVSDTNPSTWGHIDIAEFPALAVALVAVAVLLETRRLRRRRCSAANP